MYDLIVIGGGPGGLNCALYAARYSLKVLMLSDKPGGQMAYTSSIRNYLGYENISGMELTNKFVKHVKKEGAEIKQEKVISIEKGFTIQTNKGKYKSKSVVIATGANRKKLEGAEKFENKGVVYCATCDGPLYKNKVVAVVGGSNAAATTTLYLSDIAKKVYVIYRGKNLRSEAVLVKEIDKRKNVKVFYDVNIKEFVGKTYLDKIILDNRKSLDVDGVFIEIGSTPASDIVKNLVKLNKGLVKVDKDLKTSLDGMYAIGDVVDTTGDFRQICISIAEGAMAARSVLEYLQRK